MAKTNPRTEVAQLLESLPLAVLATSGDGKPHTSLVAFATAGGVERILIATQRSTKKFVNIKANCQVALLVDNRTNQVSDFMDATAVTAHGTAVELEGEDRSRMAEVFLAKHPHLKDFVSSPSTALVMVEVSKFDVANRFQWVLEMVPDG
ncbi:MAG: pyridoxamine 5'-phosphate oxidase family protein [Thermoplasmata archaeon]|nr:MAG: pyridoxamine 5'-phosphate oxidase family protein [Thermoplasmata archaeon]